jgi:hypothetical protein
MLTWLRCRPSARGSPHKVGRRLMKRLLLTLATFVALGLATSYAQAPSGGPLLLQNFLKEIAAAGPTAQATARTNLGITSGPTVPTAPFLAGVSGNLVAGTVGTGLSNTSNNLSVVYGTSAGTALQGNLLGAPGGAATLGSFGTVPIGQIPTIPNGLVDKT